jgi:hypothetical protein
MANAMAVVQAIVGLGPVAVSVVVVATCLTLVVIAMCATQIVQVLARTARTAHIGNRGVELEFRDPKVEK